MKRRRRRSTVASRSTLSVPCTWQRKPRSRYCGANSMPERPSFRAAATSPALLPMLATIPRPVTTTRRTSCRLGLEEADPDVAGFEDRLAVGLYHAVGDAQHQLAQDHALEVDMVGDLADGRRHHAAELHLADAQGPAAAGRLEPAEEEA